MPGSRSTWCYLPVLLALAATVPQTHRETLSDCMGYWDTQTHMSKTEWQAACRRTLNGTELGEAADLAPAGQM